MQGITEFVPPYIINYKSTTIVTIQKLNGRNMETAKEKKKKIQISLSLSFPSKILPFGSSLHNKEQMIKMTTPEG